MFMDFELNVGCIWKSFLEGFLIKSDTRFNKVDIQKALNFLMFFIFLLSFAGCIIRLKSNLYGVRKRY